MYNYCTFKLEMSGPTFLKPARPAARVECSFESPAVAKLDDVKVRAARL